MKDYLNEINEKFEIRRSTAQKAAFREYVKAEVEDSGYECKVEVLEKEHHNIVIGDPLTAKVVFGAHYDTPAASVVPNILIPRSILVFWLYILSFPLLVGALSLGIAYLGEVLFRYDRTVMAVIYVVLYLGAYYLATRMFDNKHNKNDNTSGVSAILSLIQQNKGNEDVAFILFDNEEKGTLGSKAFNKCYKEQMKDKLVITLDCIGNGEHFLAITQKEVENAKGYQELKKIFGGGASSENDIVSAKSGAECEDRMSYTVQLYPAKSSKSNSDYKNFPCGIGILACHKKKFVNYYTPRIHTVRDTVADWENIEFVTGRLNEFVKKLGD